MTTEIAQRRLIEALAEFRHTPGLDIGRQTDPLGALRVGLQAAIGFAQQSGDPGLAHIYAAFADLVTAVREDHHNEEEVS